LWFVTVGFRSPFPHLASAYSEIMFIRVVVKRVAPCGVFHSPFSCSAGRAFFPFFLWNVRPYYARVPPSPQPFLTSSQRTASCSPLWIDRCFLFGPSDFWPDGLPLPSLLSQHVGLNPRFCGFRAPLPPSLTTFPFILFRASTFLQKHDFPLF